MPMLIKPTRYLPRALLFYALTLSCAGFAHAKEPRWYQIEVLLFAQQPEYQRSAELWLDRFQPDYPNNPITLNPNAFLVFAQVRLVKRKNSDKIQSTA